MRKVKVFCGLLFRSINKTRNSREMLKVYSEYFLFRGVFGKNTRKMRKVYSRPNGAHVFLIFCKNKFQAESWKKFASKIF